MYRFVPAAINHPLYGGVGIYVKYGKGPDRIQVMESHPHYFWLKCPDRELIITMGSHFEHTTRPLDCNFDEYVSLSPTMEHSRNFGPEWMMQNYPQHLQKMPEGPGNRQGKRPKDGVKWMADSGGFQIVMGICDYLDPAKIARWYNDNTDFGVVLDIPSSAAGREVLLDTAKIQKKNTSILLSELNDETGLINVFHGASLEDYQAVRDIVEVDEIDRVCIANVYSGNVINCLADVIGVISEGRQYEHYHLLGLYNPSVVSLYAKYANSENFKNAKGIKDRLLTSDSSTHIQSAIARRYHFQSSPERPAVRMIAGYDLGIHKHNPHRVLPCGCPVCSTVKYMDILAFLPGPAITFTLMAHNMWEINRYMRALDNYAASMPTEDYEKMVLSQLADHGGKKSTKEAFHFLRDVEQHGIAKARSRWAAKIDNARLWNTEASHLALTSLVSDETVSALNVEGQDDFVQRIHFVSELYQTLKTPEERSRFHGLSLSKEEQRRLSQERRRRKLGKESKLEIKDEVLEKKKGRSVGNKGSRFNRTSKGGKKLSDKAKRVNLKKLKKLAKQANKLKAA